MQFPWKRHICQGGSIAKNVFLDSLSVCAKFQVGNKKCTIQPKFRAMPPDYNKFYVFCNFSLQTNKIYKIGEILQPQQFFAPFNDFLSTDASQITDFTNLRNFSASTIFLGSVSSRECLDAPAILATFTAGRTGLVACP